MIQMNDIEKLKEILISNNVSESINSNLDYLLKIIPEIKDMIGFEHNNPNHHLNVFDHTILALENSENNFDIRLILLLHDIGKPHSYQEGIDGIRHFKNHALKSVEISEKILNRLGFDKKYIKKILYIIINHDIRINPKKVNKQNYKLEKLRLMVQYADAKAHTPDRVDKWIKELDKINEMMNKNILN